MNVFNTILPIIAVAALGYAARYWRVLNEIEAAAIERVALWFLIPVLLFLGAATAAFPAEFDWRYLGVFYGVTLGMYLLAMMAGRLCFGFGWRELSVFGMTSAYGNVTVLGIPLILQFLGEGAFVPMIVVITFHNLLLFGFGTLVAGRGEAGDGGVWRKCGRVLREMLFNPISGSLLAGACWNLTGLGLYEPLRATLALLSQAAVPGALFALGAALTRYRIRGGIATALLLTLLKLAVLPLLMWLAMAPFDFPLLWQQTAVLLSAMPVGINVYVFSRRYQCLETAAATSIVLTSLLAGISSGAWTWWLLH